MLLYNKTRTNVKVVKGVRSIMSRSSIHKECVCVQYPFLLGECRDLTEGLLHMV